MIYATYKNASLEMPFAAGQPIMPPDRWRADMQASHQNLEAEAFICTRHAVVRGQQRGIRKSD